MKFTIEGRVTVLDVIEAETKEQALMKFHAQYHGTTVVVDIREGINPRTCQHMTSKLESPTEREGRLLMGGNRIQAKHETRFCPDCGERLKP